MTINNFSMTKDQYDHICHLIISSPTVDQEAIYHGFTYDPEKVQRREAIRHLIHISTVPGKVSNGKYYPGHRVLSISECIDIAKKIQTKLRYRS